MTGPVWSDLANHILFRAIFTALLESSATYWQRRADDFEWARPDAPTVSRLLDRVHDFNGQATAAELAEQDRRRAETAQACREHAIVLELSYCDDDVLASGCSRE